MPKHYELEKFWSIFSLTLKTRVENNHFQKTIYPDHNISGFNNVASRVRQEKTKELTSQIYKMYKKSF